MFKSRWISLALAGAVALSITACADNRQGAGPNNMRTNNVRPFGFADRGDMRYKDSMDHRGRLDANRTGVNWKGTTVNRLHNNTRIEVSQKIASRIAAMPEVDSANVLLTDRNAYVAVVLEDGMTGTTNNTGRATAPGRANIGGSGIVGRDDRSATPRWFNRDRNDIGARENTVLDNDVSAALKARIAAKVKSLKPDVRNVFVSANPDFVSRVNGYVDELRMGRPVRGFIRQFNELVDRIFPTNVGPANRAPAGNIGTTGR